MRLSRSIGVKLAIACLFVQLAALTLLSWSNNLTMLDRMALRFDTRLAEETRLFNASLAPPLIERDYGALQDLLNGLIDPRSIIYLVVLDRDGRVMAASGWPSDRPLPPVSTVRPSEADGRYDFALPITVGNQTYGLLRGGTSTLFFVEARNALVHRSLLISLLAAGLSGALFAGIGLWLTRRLRRVGDVNESFARGDFAARVVVSQAGDEVDRLGVGFNAMADTLERHLGEVRESQRKLKTLTNRLTLATRSARIGVWEWNPNSGQHIWDARMLELYGLEPEQAALGYKAWRERCHPDDITRVEAEIAAALAGITPFDTEFRIATPAGNIRTIRAAGLVERDDAGQPSVMIGVNQDVTQDRDNERALEAARYQAEEASRAKSEFLSNMSHEIRTPMNAIMGLIYLIGQGELSSLQRDYLEKAELSAHTLLDILSDILDFSRIEAGRLELEQAPFQLDELMKTLATVAAANALGKDIEVLLDIAPGTPVSLVGDPLRLQQILTNLADNAIKFTHHGEVILSVFAERIGAERIGADTIDLIFEVRDTGIGIAADKLDSIFEVFSQGDASTTRRYGGSGLGLAICKRLVALMGGGLQVDSTPGHGSAFRFTVRFGRGPELGKGLASPPALPAPAITTRLASVSLLLVEDNAINQLVARRVLESVGAVVEVASGGAEAVRLLTAAPARFDAVLMDIQMPDMDGYEATRIIRQTLGLTRLPVIAVTANALQADRERCLAIGMNAHLAKPINAEALFATLVAILPAQGPTLPAGSASPPAQLSPAPAQPSPDKAAWPDIPGIDGSEAAKRLNGDRALFTRLLGQAEEQFCTVVTAIRDNLIDGNPAEAIRRTHTLKGVAANLAARDVATLACSLETTIREERFADTETLLVALEVTLADLFGAISAARSDGCEPPMRRRNND